MYIYIYIYMYTCVYMKISIFASLGYIRVPLRCSAGHRARNRQLPIGRPTLLKKAILLY